MSVMLYLDVVTVMPQAWRASPAIIELLIGDFCLSSERWSCEKSDMCPVQDIKVVIDWFHVVMYDAIRMSNSPIVGANESACPAESVDQEVCRAGEYVYE